MERHLFFDLKMFVRFPPAFVSCFIFFTPDGEFMRFSLVLLDVFFLVGIFWAWIEILREFKIMTVLTIVLRKVENMHTKKCLLTACGGMWNLKTHFWWYATNKKSQSSVFILPLLILSTLCHFKFVSKKCTISYENWRFASRFHQD